MPTPADVDPSTRALCERLLAAEVFATARALLGTYGASVENDEPIEERPLQLEFCGVVGLCGRGARGSLVLGCDRPLLLATNPSPEAGMRDWMGELANQLAGGVANALVPHGLDLQIALPIVLRGEHVIALPRGEGVPVLLRTALGNACVIWELELEAGFVLSGPPPYGLPADAGELLLF